MGHKPNLTKLTSATSLSRKISSWIMTTHPIILFLFHVSLLQLPTVSKQYGGDHESRGCAVDVDDRGDDVSDAIAVL